MATFDLKVSQIFRPFPMDGSIPLAEISHPLLNALTGKHALRIISPSSYE